jgi:ribosome-binding factor A
MLRPEQLEDQVHFMLSTLIQRELRDPDLGFLTLTAVRLTGDRSIARVYYTVLGDEAQTDRSRKALGRASGFLRSHLAKVLKMRRVPELQFFPDATLEQGNKIEALFAKIKEEEAARPPQPEEDPDPDARAVPPSSEADV